MNELQKGDMVWAPLEVVGVMDGIVVGYVGDHLVDIAEGELDKWTQEDIDRAEKRVAELRSSVRFDWEPAQ